MIKYTFNESLADDNNRKNAFRQAVEMWRAAWINRKMIGNPWRPPYFACRAFVFQPHSKPVGSSSWFYMFLWCFNFIEILVWFTCAFQQAEEKEVTSAMYIHYYTLKTLWTQFARLGRLGRLQFFFSTSCHVLPICRCPEDTTCVNFVEEENPSRRIEQFMKQRCLDDLIFGYLWCLKWPKESERHLNII